MAKLPFSMAELVRRGKAAAARTKQTAVTKEAALRALVFAEAGAPPASGMARCASPAEASDKPGTASSILRH